jgi:glycosyltransferase involved in cell wall biosynthesis
MRVPPVGYGGTELVVSHLADELVRRKHEVTLFASGDSITDARLVPGSSHFLRGSDLDKPALGLANVVRCFESADEFDIIHNHTPLEGFIADLPGTPVITTLHGKVGGELLEPFLRYQGWYNAISYSAKSLLPDKERCAGVVYNAIDCSSYFPNLGPRDDYLLYFSRMSEEKGPHIAIEVAKRLERRLVMAGNVNWGTPDEEFFKTQVWPLLDNEQIIYVGEADAQQKRELLCNASCLLAPIIWPEPFGLFMVEAQACGTPVIAFRHGAAPEVVCHERSGFIVADVDEMVDTVSRIEAISPYECRMFVEEKFNVERMVDDYVQAYESVLAAESRPFVDISSVMKRGLLDALPTVPKGLNSAAS